MPDELSRRPAAERPVVDQPALPPHPPAQRRPRPVLVRTRAVAIVDGCSPRTFASFRNEPPGLKGEHATQPAVDRVHQLKREFAHLVGEVGLVESDQAGDVSD